MPDDDQWRDDDPALVRLRDAMALQPVQEPRSEPKAPTPLSEDVKRSRIASLIALIRSGDRSAAETLRGILDRENRG